MSMKAVVVMPNYSKKTNIDESNIALAREIMLNCGLTFHGTDQWAEIIILSPDADLRPYRTIPLLAMGDYACYKAKLFGCTKLVTAPSPLADTFAGCRAFERLNHVAGEDLKWGSRTSLVGTFI